LDERQLKARLHQLAQEEQDGHLRWLPLEEQLVMHARSTLRQLPATVFLRAADALHLACAADAGLKEIYSHDRHLLAAASHFGLNGIDVIKAP
jgi:predicted nucleic acid-binding protein